MNDLEINQAFLQLAELCLPCDEDVSKNLNPIRHLNEANLRTALAVTMAQLARAQNRLRKAMPLAIEARLIQTIVLNEELQGTNIDEICLGNLSDDDLYKIAMHDSEFDTTYEPDLKYGIDLSVFRAVNEALKLKRSQTGRDGAAKRNDRKAQAKAKAEIKIRYVEWVASGKKGTIKSFINTFLADYEVIVKREAIERYIGDFNKELKSAQKI